MEDGQAWHRLQRLRQERASAEPDLLYIRDMKVVQLVGLIASAAILVSCETTQTAGTGTGNQEQKRIAQIQRQQQEAAQYDESDVNLWNAHQDTLVKGTNPMIPYAPIARY